MASTSVSIFDGFDGASLPEAFRAAPAPNDLASGMSGGFAVVSFRSSRWAIRYQGEETIIRNADGDPVRKLLAVIVAANPTLSKTYYAGNYTPGSNDAPDCFSNDGVTPDPAVPEPVSRTCGGCPMNQIGSAKNDAGKKLKACQDNRRLAIVPASDIANEAYGGPMLLRVPPASLAPLAEFHRELSRKAPGLPYYAVAVEIGFDETVEYPRLTFTPRKIVTNDEVARQIVAMREDAIVESILYGSVAPDAPTGGFIPALKAAEPKAPAAPKAVEPKSATPKPAEPEEVEEDEEPEEAPQKPAAAKKSKTVRAAAPVVSGSDVDSLLAGL